MNNRSLARQVAKARMKKEGLTRVCAKGNRNGKNDRTINKHCSWFAAHWKDYAYTGGKKR